MCFSREVLKLSPALPTRPLCHTATLRPSTPQYLQACGGLWWWPVACKSQPSQPSQQSRQSPQLVGWRGYTHSIQGNIQTSSFVLEWLPSCEHTRQAALSSSSSSLSSSSSSSCSAARPPSSVLCKRILSSSSTCTATSPVPPVTTAAADGQVYPLIHRTVLPQTRQLPNSGCDWVPAAAQPVETHHTQHYTQPA